MNPLETPRADADKPLVLITGAAGAIGSALVAALSPAYRVVGLDREGMEADCELHAFDLTSPESCTMALEDIWQAHGGHVAAVIHLAAYFDFSGEESPLYQAVNVDGTRNLIRALRAMAVERFIYSGTMLVHRPRRPGETIDEETPLEPKWAYPVSKARTEDVIRAEHGDMPYVLLHLAGVYDERTAVPTLTEQIRRIYERDPKAHLYAGSVKAGQAFLHKDDMIDAFRRAVDRRNALPDEVTILIGEPDTASYEALQHRIGQLVHGEADWHTHRVPKLLAEAGAWVEEKSEPLVPDVIDHGEKPFIRPFMVAMADDHYELDVTRARELLGWQPKHRLFDALPAMVGFLKSDPLRWYRENGLTPPDWLDDASGRADDPERLRARREHDYREAHAQFLWAPFLNIALGLWLTTSPPVMNYQSPALAWSDVISGLVVMALAVLSLSWRFGLVRWALAAAAIWIMSAPLVFWAPTAAAYLNGTLVGALVFSLAVLARPAPGVGVVAAASGPTVPPGWDYSPSDWLQRIPIIALAVVGLYVSRYLTAYQLGHIDAVWDPFFAGVPQDPKNGTEEIITSWVSEAWPVPDAGLGALTYMLEILSGIIGSRQRWRTMPWVVVLFGFMIVPLGVVSITFIIIQPIVLGTWCTLCLVAAAAMVIQIPYSVDELIATGQFLGRRRRAGRPLLRVFFAGDTDDGPDDNRQEDFERPARVLLREMIGGGITLPWTLALSVLIGVWLMLTRLTIGTEGLMADADHLVGALVITVSVAAMGETVRSVRFVNTIFGLVLLAMPFIADANSLQMANGLVAGLALMLLSIPRGRIRCNYGRWNRLVV